MTANHRRVAEVAVLPQARVAPSQVVETNFETDVPPTRNAILVSAPAQACRLTERTNGSVKRAIPLYQEAADLNVTTHDDRRRLRRRRRRSDTSEDQSNHTDNEHSGDAPDDPVRSIHPNAESHSLLSKVRVPCAYRLASVWCGSLQVGAIRNRVFTEGFGSVSFVAAGSERVSVR
jgi:hypothetical protein